MFTWFIYRMLTIRPERTRKQIAVSSALTGFLFAAGLTVYLYVDIPVTDSVLYVLAQAAYRFHMPWDNSVNKMAHIHAVVTTLGVRNMPLTDCVRTPGSISLSRQAGICKMRLTAFCR